MINPFTIQSKISRLQQDVLTPLYTMHPEQAKMDHGWLLVLTGRVIEANRTFLEELAASNLVAAVFKIVKLLGGAGDLTEDDFDRFTSYINDGGLKAMVAMLLASDKEKTFVAELKSLPPEIRANASAMLKKSASLHHDFIRGYFKEQHGDFQAAPAKLRENFKKSEQFILRLASLASKYS